MLVQVTVDNVQAMYLIEVQKRTGAAKSAIMRLALTEYMHRRPISVLPPAPDYSEPIPPPIPGVMMPPPVRPPNNN